MFSLILKDILVQKKQVLFSLLYIVFIIIAFQAIGPAMFTAGIIAFTYMLTVTACAYEDKNSSYTVLGSLPIKRSRIVLSKYMSSLVFLSMGGAAYAIINYVFVIARIPLKTYPITLESLLGTIFAFAVLTGIYFPVFFKLGYIKSKYINFILFFTFFFGINLTVKLFVKMREEEWVRKLLSFFASQPDETVAAIILLIAAAMLVLSYLLSVRFFNSREL